ncbi:MAG: hypothetical protein ACK48V_04490, partial [Crocinitomicaceae bacterium]
MKTNLLFLLGIFLMLSSCSEKSIDKVEESINLYDFTPLKLNEYCNLPILSFQVKSISIPLFLKFPILVLGGGLY